MQKENILALSSPLESVQYQFEKWRETRKSPREPIPENLWAAAISLCNQHSINHVSRALHLSYTALKKRIPGRKPVPRKKKSSSPFFVELDWQRNFPSSECIIEMENAYGSKMRMSFKGQADLDLLELSRAFWTKGK
jgi:hypothetical protein